MTHVVLHCAEYRSSDAAELAGAELQQLQLQGDDDDDAEIAVVDRLVFVYVGGFELGGGAIEAYFARSGAIRCVSDRAHLVVKSTDPVANARELAAFLVDEDYEQQFTLLIDGAVELRPFHDEQIEFLFTVTLANAEHTCVLGFDDSGVQDWAFVSLLYQLCGMDPSLG